MGTKKDDLDQGFLTKQKGEKHVKKIHEKTETVEDARHTKANLKRRVEELELYELEHDEDEYGEDYSRYIK